MMVGEKRERGLSGEVEQVREGGRGGEREMQLSSVEKDL